MTTMMTERERLKGEIEELTSLYGSDRSALMPILQDLQRKYHHISNYAMQVVADLLKIHPVEIFSVVTFYSFLKLEKQGRFVIRLCKTLSCDLHEKERVARQLENDLGIKFGETTPDGAFTLEYVNCIGMCDQGPAMLINDKVITRVHPEQIQDILEDCRRQFGLHATERKVSHI
jgi:[NiFe] hydrogenase diaphorase moiety large subunit